MIPIYLKNEILVNRGYNSCSPQSMLALLIVYPVTVNIKYRIIFETVVEPNVFDVPFNKLLYLSKVQLAAILPLNKYSILRFYPPHCASAHQTNFCSHSSKFEAVSLFMNIDIESICF